MSYIFVLLISFLISVTPSSANSTNSSRPSKSGVPLALSIDLRTCECLDANQDCELVIKKSKLMEVQCPETHHFCCGRDKLQDADKQDPALSTSNNTNKVATTDAKLEFSAALQNSSLTASNTDMAGNTTTVDNVRMRISSVQELKEDVEPSASAFESKQQIKCRCKPRAKCSARYTDYSFGFHCSYDKVRCCEPIALIQKELEEQKGGQLMLINVQNPSQFADNGEDQLIGVNSFQNAYNIDEEQNNCLCLPPTDCNLKLTNEIFKRRDMACPFNFIQCCGSAIIIKKPEEKSPDMANHNESGSPSDDEYIEGRGMATNSLPGTRQSPVQLPKLVIPTDEPLLDVEINTSTTTTQAPPSLPTFYQENQPKTDQTGHMYYSQVLRPNPPSQSYFKGQIAVPTPSHYQVPVQYYTQQNTGNQLQPSRNSYYLLPSTAGGIPFVSRRLSVLPLASAGDGSSARGTDDSFLGSIFRWFTS